MPTKKKKASVYLQLTKRPHHVFPVQMSSVIIEKPKHLGPHGMAKLSTLK